MTSPVSLPRGFVKEVEFLYAGEESFHIIDKAQSCELFLNRLRLPEEGMVRIIGRLLCFITVTRVTMVMFVITVLTMMIEKIWLVINIKTILTLVIIMNTSLK